MQIYLSRPGGQREGPFTVDQVNDALARQTYQGSDYWAWYDGLTEWVPLYSVPGVHEPAAALAGISSGRSNGRPDRYAKANASDFATQMFTAPRSDAPAASDTAFLNSLASISSTSEEPSASSGLPFSALEQIFILTTGEGQAASRSPITSALIGEVAGEDWETIRQVVPRDAIARCAVLNDMTGQVVPPLVWRAMTAFKPALMQKAREGAFRICIRCFQIESGDMVAVFLFYSKAKLM